MSYITLDYYCNRCGLTEERFVKREDMDKQTCDCTAPTLIPMVRMPAATATTFKYADPSATKRRR